MLNLNKTNKRSVEGSDIDGNTKHSYIARIRRLKIQEGILTSTVNKTYEECLGVCDGNNKYNNTKKIKKYLHQLKDSYNDMKNLYEDIKVKTHFHEKTLDATDIEDLKKDILELEEKIKNFKQFLREELNSLQAEENAVVEEVNSIHFEAIKSIGNHKIKKKTYKEIVPSPVKSMIKCPFKCVEVHKLQEFMKASPNRYGGWNEHNHNLFVQIWNKYNGNVIFTSQSICDPRLFQEFKHEVLQKISDARFEDIQSHIEWYSQYINLKTSQKEALDKWKENKNKIKKSLRDAKMYNSFSDSTSVTGSASENKNGSKLVTSHRLHGKSSNTECGTIHLPNKVQVSKLMQPTKQWINRCESAKGISRFECDIENVSKLRIPNWRLSVESIDICK